MNDIIVLNIDFYFGSMKDAIHPVILKDDNELILVDCGYPNFLTNIKEAALSENININNLTKII
ncbi:MAG: fold metallo-hydrolase, partial [Clostridia bacterium]|nr:fold metallo-hydrolase [Clostridia bacterium]